MSSELPEPPGKSVLQFTCDVTLDRVLLHSGLQIPQHNVELLRGLNGVKHKGLCIGFGGTAGMQEVPKMPVV